MVGIPDAADVLSELARRGLTVGMASNFDSRLIVLLESVPRTAPKRNRCVVISSSVGSRKPAREFFDDGVDRGLPGSGSVRR